jgi:hypothetical protein
MSSETVLIEIKRPGFQGQPGRWPVLPDSRMAEPKIDIGEKIGISRGIWV